MDIIVGNYLFTIQCNHNQIKKLLQERYRPFLADKIARRDPLNKFTIHTEFDNIFDEKQQKNDYQVIFENQPGPPYFYDYNIDGSFTKALFLFGAAGSPNLNTPQTYINPPIVEYLLDENAMIIDTVYAKWQAFELSQLIHQLTPDDSVGIYFSCGVNDGFLLYNSHLAMQDTLDLLGLPYEFYSHSGGHNMPISFKYGAYTFLDSLLMPPGLINKINQKSQNKTKLQISNFPNPFTNSTTIQYELSEKGYVELAIWNHLGQEVEKLFEGNKNAGRHQTVFDASKLPAGIYFCRFKTGNEMKTKKIIKL